MEKKGHLNLCPRIDNQLGAKKARAGRPFKSVIPESIGHPVTRLAASFLQLKIPDKSTRRKFNQAMVGWDGAPPGGKEPADLLQRLAARKSIPPLSQDDSVMAGIWRLESSPLFAGSLQILFGPYVDLLRPHRSVSVVHSLMALCKHAQARSQRIFKWYWGSARRTRRAAADEARELMAAVRISKLRNRWQQEFLDFLAVALGSFQESVITQDAAGIATWRGILLGPELSFRAWPHCSPTRQDEMNSLVAQLVARAPSASLDIPLAYVSHYLTHVNDRRSKDPIQLCDMVAHYMAIRNGNREDLKTECQLLESSRIWKRLSKKESRRCMDLRKESQGL